MVEKLKQIVNRIQLILLAIKIKLVITSVKIQLTQRYIFNSEIEYTFTKHYKGYEKIVKYFEYHKNYNIEEEVTQTGLIYSFCTITRNES